MIDKHPAPGNFTGWLENHMGRDGGPSAMNVSEPAPARMSQVLGPDGNPLRIDIPRRVVGFDLRRRNE